MVRRVNRIAQLAEPIVSEAIADFTAWRVSDVSPFSQSIVVSTSCRLPRIRRRCGVDLPKLDHVGDLHHPVQQSETGVGQIVDDRGTRQTQSMVDRASGGRFE